jgi:hypothetical protein
LGSLFNSMSGGNSCLRGGKGERIERMYPHNLFCICYLYIIFYVRRYREVRIACVGAGSEEIMQDLAIRQSARRAKL